MDLGTVLGGMSLIVTAAGFSGGWVIYMKRSANGNGKRSIEVNSNRNEERNSCSGTILSVNQLEGLEALARKLGNGELSKLSLNVAEINKKLDDPHMGLSAMNDKLVQSTVALATLTTEVKNLKEDYVSMVKGINNHREDNP